MMFSTKAEYGVRVMVELARRSGEDPVPLAEIAEHDGLPLAYLEHVVARLRKAELVDARRGSRGGYLLARSPTEITMAEVVQALEGTIAPIECISEAADGSIVCSRESDPGHVCPTKLLWTRVRGAIVRTLRETTLADLVLAPSLPVQAADAPLGIEPLASARETGPVREAKRARGMAHARGATREMPTTEPATSTSTAATTARGAKKPLTTTTTTGA